MQVYVLVFDMGNLETFQVRRIDLVAGVMAVVKLVLEFGGSEKWGEGEKSFAAVSCGFHGV
jgi:hypothetical protein